MFATLDLMRCRSPKCKGVQILESGKFLLVDSGVLGFGIRNKAQGIQNATKD